MNSFNLLSLFRLTIIPVVLPSSLITNSLNTGLLIISSNPLFLSMSLWLRVL